MFFVYLLVLLYICWAFRVPHYLRLFAANPRFYPPEPVEKPKTLFTYVCRQCGATRKAASQPICDNDHAVPLLMHLADSAEIDAHGMLRAEYSDPPEEPVYLIPPQGAIPDEVGPGVRLMYCPKCYLTANGEMLKPCPNHEGEAPVMMAWGDESQLDWYHTMQQLISPD